MAIELISELLAATDPRELGQALTEQLRELTGARTVLLVAHRDEPAAHEVLYASPPRRATLFSESELGEFCPLRTQDALPIRSEELLADHPLRGPLLRAGAESLLRVPLRTAAELKGFLLLLDLAEVDRAGDTVEILTLLAPPIALALKNVLASQQLEERRRQAEAARDRLFDNSLDLLCIAGFDGFFKQLNPAWTATLGWTAAELQAQPWLDFIHPEDREATVNAGSRLSEGQAVRGFENRYRCRDGAYRWLSWNSFPLPGEQLILAVVRDVTEAKRAEEALRKTNRALKVISECSQALVRAKTEAELLQQICRLLVDHGGYRMAWIGFAEQDEAKSVRLAAHYGVEDGYLETVNITWADAERGRGPTGAAIRTGQHVIARNIPTDPTFGPWREAAITRDYMSSIALPLPLDGQIVGALSIYAAEPDAFRAEDVALLTELADDLAFGLGALRTQAARDRAEEQLRQALAAADTSRRALLSVLEDQKQAEEQIRRRRDELAALLRASRTFASTLHRGGVLQATTDVAVELTTLRSAAVYLLEEDKLHLAATTPPLPAQCPDHLRDAPLADHPHIGRAVTTRLPVFLPDSATADLTPAERAVTVLRGLRSILYVPLLAGPRVVGTLIVAAAGEPRVLSEGEIDLCRTLANLAALAIENAQLFESLQRHAGELEERVRDRTAQLAARNEELRGFAYTVSHDLKAPLRGIIGYAQELERRHKEGLGERARFCVAQVVAASRNLDALIEDLLRYSRLDAETPTLSNVVLGDLVRGILEDHSLATTQPGVEVTVDLPPLTLCVWQRGLHQVLTNLIDNALKYSCQSTPPRVTITANALPGAIRVTVADNGIGFDMKYHDRIFGLFNRLVRADEFEGTGVGLAIVKKVTDRLGGRVWAKSAPGQGATFTVEVPL